MTIGYGKKVHYKPIWPRIVQDAKRLGLDPIRLIAVLFEAAGTGPSPQPTGIVSDANVRRYHAYAKTQARHVALDRRTEEAVFKSAVWAATQTYPDPVMATTFVLNDMSRPLSPLFRYCAARLKKLDEIADRWQGLAFRQITGSPEGYLEAWETLLPDDAKAAAKVAAGRAA